MEELRVHLPLFPIALLRRTRPRVNAWQCFLRTFTAADTGGVIEDP